MKIKQNTNTEHKHFIYLDKQLIAIHIKTDTTSTADTTNTPTTPIPDKTRYLHYGGTFQFVGHTLYRSCVSDPSHQYAHDL
jgi:hypothetical protein